MKGKSQQFVLRREGDEWFYSFVGDGAVMEQ